MDLTEEEFYEVKQRDCESSNEDEATSHSSGFEDVNTNNGIEKDGAGRAVLAVGFAASENKSQTGRVLQLNPDFDKIINCLEERISNLKDRPQLSIIASTGPSPKENAWLMNTFVRYLTRLESAEVTENWIDEDFPSAEDAFPSNESEIDQGIWMWSRPFVIPDPADPTKSTAVLLMNVEGCFDAFLTEEEKQAIFGLALLTSSCMIVNDSSKIDPSTLAKLGKFIRSGREASEEAFKTSEFEDLLFLIRDWVSPTYSYGLEGGQTYVRKCLAVKAGMTQEAKANRQIIMDSFEHYGAFLMPHPGHEFYQHERSSRKQMTTDFREQLENFVVSTIKSLRPHKILATLSSPAALKVLISSYLDAFNTAESSASAVDEPLMENESKTEKFVRSYDEALRRKLEKKGGPFVRPQKLEKWHKEIKEFLNLIEERDNESWVDQRNQLEEIIEGRFRIICSEIETTRDEFLEDATQRATERFHKHLESIGLLSEQEFNASVAAELQQCLHDLNMQLEKAPADVIQDRVTFLETELLQAKQTRWAEVRAKRKEVEDRIMELVKSSVDRYHDNMKILCTGEYVSAVELEKTHKKCAKVARKHFQDCASAASFGHDTVSEYLGVLEEFLLTEFKAFEHQRTHALKSFETEMETNVNDAVSIFREEVDEVVVQSRDMEDAKERLEGLRVQIRDFCIEALDDVKCPDSGITRKWKGLLEEKLNEVREETLNQLRERFVARDEQSRSFLEESKREVSSTLQTLLNSDLDTEEIQREISSALGNIADNLRGQLESIQSPEVHHYLTQLEEFVKDERQRIQFEVSKKREETEQMVQAKVVEFKSQYEKQMNNTAMRSLEELEKTHEDVLASLVQEFMDHLMDSFGKPATDHQLQALRDAVENQFEAIKGKFIAHAETELASKLEEAALEQLNEFASQCTEGPLTSETETDAVLDERLQQFDEKVTKEISTFYYKGSELYARALERLTKKKEEQKLKLKSKAQEIRVAKGDEIAKVVQSCVEFAEKLLEEVAQKEFEDYMAELGREFAEIIVKAEEELNRLWTSEECKKAEAIKQVRSHMESKFADVRREVRETMEEKEQFLNLTLAECVKNVGFNLEESFHDGVFYSMSFLDQVLRSRADVYKDFVSIMKTSSYEVTPRIEALFNEKMDERIRSIYAKNHANETAVFDELAGRIPQWFREDDVNTLEDLRAVSRNVTARAESFLLRNMVGRLGDAPEILERMQEMCEASRKNLEAVLRKEFMKNLGELLPSAERKYRESMDEFIGTTNLPLHPRDLQEYHIYSVKAVLRKLGQQGFIPDEGKARIQSLLELVYKRYEERNLLKSAEDTNDVVGIDLGTTTSCVAIYKHGEVRVIRDQSGRNLNPSYVYFPDIGPPVVGQEAKDEAHIHNPEDTIYDAKRLIGRDMSDPNVQNDILRWPFNVVAGANGKPQIVVRKKRVEPEEISAEVLRKMVQIAEADLGQKITKAVITVPANFNDRQRGATMQAAQLAGLEVLQIISEPTAAAMAHALGGKAVNRTTLVVDFGGGTLDVSILKTVEDNSGPSTSSRRSTSHVRLDVLTTAGDTHLGGEDLDELLLEHCVKVFKEANDGIDLLLPEPGKPNSILGVKRRRRRLRTECEKAKHVLTSAQEATVNADAIYGDKSLFVKVTRGEFERMCEPLFQKVLEVVEKALNDADLDKADIDEVLMVGGSSRIPRMKELLQNFLEIPLIHLNQRVDLQEAVAKGAAIQGCILSGGKAAITLPRVKDVQPFSLGIEIIDGYMSVIIPRNSKIPFEATKHYETTEDNQREVEIVIYSGEEEMARDNIQLGQFRLLRIPPGPRGSQVIDVNMKIDTNGILNVKATCVSNGVSRDVVIQEHRGRLSEGQIEYLTGRFL